MKKITTIIISILISHIALSNFTRFVDASNITRVITQDDKEFYEIDFKHNSFEKVVMTPTNYYRFIENPVKRIYEISVNSTYIPCYIDLGNMRVDTINFRNYIKNVKKYENIAYDVIILIPKVKDVEHKVDFTKSVDISIISKHVNLIEQNRNEVAKLKGSTKKEYQLFLKKKAIELYSKYDKIEDIILDISMYTSSLIDYDLNAISNQDKTDIVLESNKGVCASYTHLFAVMIDTIAKIDDRIGLHGTFTYIANCGLPHICNIIEVNSKLYRIDVTGINVYTKYPDAYKDIEYSVSYIFDKEIGIDFMSKTLPSYKKELRYDIIYSKNELPSDYSARFENSIRKYLLNRM